MWRGRRCFLLPYRAGCFHEHAFALSSSCTYSGFHKSLYHEDLLRVLDAILHFLHSLYDPEGLKELIRSGGAPLVFIFTAGHATGPSEQSLRNCA